MTRAVQYLGIILVVNVSFLFSPPPTPYELALGYHTHYRLNDHGGFKSNGDSRASIDAAMQPSLLFEPKNLRQGRPLYVLAGAVTGRALYAATTPVHDQMAAFLERRQMFQSEAGADRATVYAHYYAAFVLLNAVVLLCACAVFTRIVTRLSGP